MNPAVVIMQLMHNIYIYIYIYIYKYIYIYIYIYVYIYIYIYVCIHMLYMINFSVVVMQLIYNIYIYFSIWVFYHDHSQITGLQGKGEGISLTPHYHFHPLHRYLDISRAITAESSPLHIASSRTRTGNLWFPSASC